MNVRFNLTNGKNLAVTQTVSRDAGLFFSGGIRDTVVVDFQTEYGLGLDDFQSSFQPCNL